MGSLRLVLLHSSSWVHQGWRTHSATLPMRRYSLHPSTTGCRNRKWRTRGHTPTRARVMLTNRRCSCPATIHTERTSKWFKTLRIVYTQLWITNYRSWLSESNKVSKHAGLLRLQHRQDSVGKQLVSAVEQEVQLLSSLKTDHPQE